MSAAARRGVPPTLALRVLRAVLSDEVHESFVGDLVELHARLAMHRPLRADLWFCRQTIAATFAFALHRRARPVPSPRGDSAMLLLGTNLRIGARMLRRAPTFTAICVGTLGLGIGATTAIFSLANPLLLRRLPYPDPGQIVMASERTDNGRPGRLGYTTFVDYTREMRTLASAAAFGSWQVTLGGAGDAERLDGERVSRDYFRTLGVQPALGRDFLAEEDTPDRHAVVILTHALWKRRFAGDPAIIGRTIQLEGSSYTVAGVMPATFEDVITPGAQIYRALGYDVSKDWACRDCRHLQMVARVRHGATVAAAHAELDAVGARLAREYPKTYRSPETSVEALQAYITDGVRPVLAVLLGAVTLVLLISIANVTSLQLGRALRREGEFAIRVALGAGRARLAGQLLAEGMLLAVAGGVAGIGIAAVVLPALVARLPNTLPRLGEVQLDPVALGIAAFVTLVIGIVVGLVPAWRGDRAAGLSERLRPGTRLTGSARHLARTSLVVSEVAFALMLLAGAGLLSRSLLRLMSMDVGFDPSHLLTMEVQAGGPAYSEDAAVWASHDRMIAAVRSLPGVEAVATASQLPFAGNYDSYGVVARDRPEVTEEFGPSPQRFGVTPDFLRAMRVVLVQGRSFTDADNRQDAPMVAIVSTTFAAKMWPGGDPLGKQIRMGGPTRPWRTVIGVATNVRHTGLDDATSSQFYVPERQWYFSDNSTTLVVRTAGEPAALASSVRSAIRGVDATMPIVHLATMEQLVGATTAQRRLALVLFAAFATLALVLCGAGMYGVLATRVAERTREIGVRTALGATPRDILALIARQAVPLVVGGGVLGVIGAIALTRYLRSLLFGVEPTDPATLTAVGGVLIGIAVVACAAPAVRALRVDPARALRQE